jgi:triacylglycerol lipase
MGKGANLAAAAGLGAAVFVGLGCGIAAADDDGGGASVASDKSSQHDAGPVRDQRVKNRNAQAALKVSERARDDEPTHSAGAVTARTSGENTEESNNRTAANDATEDNDTTVAVDLAQDIDDAEGIEANPDPVGVSDRVPAPAAIANFVTVTAAARRELDPGPPAPPTAVNQTVTAPDNSVTYTDEPTFFDQIVVASLYVMRGISSFIGVDIYGLIGKALESDEPPWFVKSGLDVRRTEYEVTDGNTTWDVWEFHPPNPTEKTVVAVHGGGFIVQPLITHWLDYADMARETGATVIVPMYPLATTEAGTAVKVVPAMAQFLSDQIAAYGAENVSIYADSAGPSLAMAAVRELILAGKPVPASMVLLSFTPDASLSNPAIYDINDPIIDVRNLDFYTGENHWSDGLDAKDPLVSPLFIEEEVLAALPATTIYIGELEYALPDIVLLQDKWSAAGGVVSTVVGRGQFHDWALGGLSFNSAGPKVRPDIYRQLGLDEVATAPRRVTAARSPRN